MTSGPFRMVCAGCGAGVPPDAPHPFRCPEGPAEAGDVDHVLVRLLDPERVAPPDEDPQPFVRYRTRLRSYHLALVHGMDDAAFVSLVRELDDAVGAVCGTGFFVTPFALSRQGAEAVGLSSGTLRIKDETGHVGGSHKARHLFGILLQLEVARRTGLFSTKEKAPLAIASCGNAALAAAIVAKAGGRALTVFIPTDADPAVVSALREHDASLTTCAREEGVPGDPCVTRFRQAVEGGALPFTCQGPENGLAIEGGHTLGWEMAEVLAAEEGRLGHVLVQTGGGALASGVAAGLAEAAALGVLPRLPRVHTVQTRGAFPLERAWDRVASRALEALHAEGALPHAIPEGAAARADLLRTHADWAAVATELAHAVTHRAEYMWPWEGTPRSIATGILDDETYDWFAVVCGMIRTGGIPVIVSEETLADANAIAREAVGIRADATGSAGLAGLMRLVRAGEIGAEADVAVLFTGTLR